MIMKPAQPNPEEAAHFARLAQIAGDNVFSILFGSRAEAVLRSMFMRRDNDSSHSHARFLLEGEAIAGLLHGYSAPQARAFANRSTWLYLRYAGWQLPRFLASIVLMGDLLDFIAKDLDERDFYIAMLALYPEYRGRGYGRALLDEAEGLAAEAGCARLALDVDERNTVARAVYARYGFVEIAQSKKVTEKGERWGLLRLAKPLMSSQSAPAM